MGFFSIKLRVRITDNTKRKIKELIKINPEKFGDISDVIRIAVLKLHTAELPHSKLKTETILKVMKDED